MGESDRPQPTGGVSQLAGGDAIAADELAVGPDRERWLTAGVGGIGVASLLSDLGHEVPTSLLPSFLSSTLHAPASALGIIEGIADGAAGVARLAGGALSDDPARRRSAAVGGYTTVAVFSSLIGVAGAAWQVGIFRAIAWGSRGLRVPARNALLADLVPAAVYGRAYGFERAMDNLGAIGGPLLAIALLGLVGTRSAILLSVIPGLLATVAILYAIHRTRTPTVREHRPIRLVIRPLLHGRLGGLLAAATAFELGNLAATLLILRATQLLHPGRSETSAAEIALLLYTVYNLTAALTSVPAGHVGDRRGMLKVLGAGAVAFVLAYGGFASSGESIPLLAASFAIAGVGIGFAETAETAAVAQLAPEQLRGSAFGALAAAQAIGNLAASAVAGILWSAISPTAAFLYVAAWMLISLLALAATSISHA